MTANVTGDSHEAVAYSLMLDVLTAGGQANAAGLIHFASNAYTASGSMKSVTEQEILALYGRCLAVVNGKTAAPVTNPGDGEASL